MSLPAVEIMFNLNNVPTRICFCGAKVRAVFDPAFCFRHRHVQANIHHAGWGFITQYEADLLTLIRSSDWKIPELISGFNELLEIREGANEEANEEATTDVDENAVAEEEVVTSGEESTK